MKTSLSFSRPKRLRSTADNPCSASRSRFPNLLVALQGGFRHGIQRVLNGLALMLDEGLEQGFADAVPVGAERDLVIGVSPRYLDDVAMMRSGISGKVVKGS